MKIKSRFVKILSLLTVMALLSLGLYYSVRMYGFVKAIQIEARNNMKHHKNFIKSLPIDGIIVDKIWCSSCKINKYRIIIELKNFNVNGINTGNDTYEPYYTIDSNKINLSVTKEIYINANIGDKVIKHPNSITLKIGGKNFKFLDDSEYFWFPADTQLHHVQN